VRLAQMLKQRLPKLPILIATAHAMTGDRERLMQASGADGYLEKPIYDAQALVDKVQELLK
jgi:two-component system cell cycle response regulator DivK